MAKKTVRDKAGKQWAKNRRARGYKVARKRSSNVPEYASLSVKRTIVPTQGQNYVTNQLYSLMNTQLSDYPRAVTVASAYQHFRIKKISLTFKPTFDTFSGVGPNVMSKMNLYFMIDKAGSIPTNVTLEGLKNMGARPFSLDEQPKKISWSPSVLEASQYAAGLGNTVASKYLISPWLSTANNPISPGAFVASGVDHLGIYWYCEQLVTQVAQPYQCELEVQFEFKKPLASGLTGDTHAIASVAAEINTSPQIS